MKSAKLEAERIEGVESLITAGMLDQQRIRGGDWLPPGAVPFNERVLARYVVPGATRQLHGVAPIGMIGLPRGWVAGEIDDDVEEIRVLPFRVPGFDQVYALRCGHRLHAIMRNIQPMEINSGLVGVVQFNDARNWNAVFGKITRATLATFDLRLPEGPPMRVSHEEVQFVGKVHCWWDDLEQTKAERKSHKPQKRK